MSITSILISLSSIHVLALGISIPPSFCFEPFNGLDCGRNPVHVLFYYKPGSRCEVAIWRGCPTRNKFKDEYECINTCIFTERPRPEEHLNFENEDDYQLDYVELNKTIEAEVTTIAADSGFEADDEDGDEKAGENDTKETGGEETKESLNGENEDEENAAEEKADDENAEADIKNAADEAIEDAGEGDEETKVEATSEGTMEIGSEEIGAN